MKTTIRTVALIGVGLLLLPLCIWALFGQPWVYKARTDIDLSSGDLRDRIYVFSLVLSSQIYESDLSREVRRLGISIPPARVWRRMGESHLVQYSSIDPVYGHVMNVDCDRLLFFLGETNTPEEERRAILEKFMTNLRTGDPRRASEQACLLAADVAGKHDLHPFSPQFEAYIRDLRAARSQRDQGQP